MTVYGAEAVRFGSVSMVTATLGANDPQIGDVVTEGDEKYIFVFNGGGSDIAPGLGATVSAVTGYTVTVSTTGYPGVLVGVCKHATLTTATYGWLLQRGFGPLQASAAVAIATGDAVLAGTNGFFTNVVTSALTSTPQGPICGRCVVSAASASTLGDAYYVLG